MAEDQDRIQKAFRIFSDGLLAVPFSGGNGSCNVQGSGVELIAWTQDSLTARALLPVSGNPRRAVRRDSTIMKELIAVSDSNVRSFAIDQPEVVKQTADVVIGTCLPRTTPNGMPLGGYAMGDDVQRGGYDPMPSGHAYGSCY
jgi:hypothetical protein